MLIFFLVTLGWIVLIARFAQIQIIEGAKYEDMVIRQCWNELKLSAKRGAIFDRHGNLITFDIPSESFYTQATDRGYLRTIARQISKLTGESGLTKRLLNRAGKFNWLARHTDFELAKKINALKLDSVQSHPEYRRAYPYNSLAVDILGQVDIDNLGRSGLELAFDDQLRPDPGLARFQRDGKGRIYRLSDVPIVRPHDGRGLKLTLDIEYQQIVEEELKRAVDKWDAISGMAVFIEVATGRVLAADYYSASTEDANTQTVFKTRVVTDLFEPGSAAKIVTFAGMIENHLFSLQDTIWAGMGKFEFNGHILRDDKKYGTLTLRRAFELSSNIATARFSQKLGGKRLFRYARQFGFGQPTGIDLLGEERGWLKKPENWSEYWIAMTSIGHGFSVTALQMATAFAAIANDGVMMKPYVVEEIRSETGRLKQRFTPQIVRRVISKETAAILQDLMGGVVDSGTAKVARMDEVLFSGKTSTAQKPNLESGGYYWNKYTASFCGFFPRKTPRIAGIVIIDEPKRIHYGGYTAAPAFAEIAKRITMQEKTRENWTEKNRDGINTNRHHDSNLIADSGTNRTKSGIAENLSDYQSIHQWLLNRRENTAETNRHRLDQCADELRRGTLPDLTGLPARDAVILLGGAGCKIIVKGNGRVESQSPEAGCILETIESVVMKCASITGG